LSVHGQSTPEQEKANRIGSKDTKEERDVVRMAKSGTPSLPALLQLFPSAFLRVLRGKNLFRLMLL
jgi:hypothetical protein